ncbi:Galactokinase [Homalodisca vitripennis]|nr:Galactokinase [Homalodisca vitripennis]
MSKEKEALLKKAVVFFKESYGYDPKVAGYAPGRVNLIGEHTDYNDGFVLPIALNLGTVLVGSTNSSDLCKIKSNASLDEDTSAEFHVPSVNKLLPGEPKWANYVRGVVAFFKGTVKGFDAVVVSNVPLGGGLSSSASLEVATYMFLEGLFGKTDCLKEKALICQRAEHEFASTPCGIMDQFISMMGAANNALLIDCMKLTSELIPMDIEDCVILITNTNVKHNLGTSEYAVRRSQCEEAARILKVRSLRFATLEELNSTYTSANVTFRNVGAIS